MIIENIEKYSELSFVQDNKAQSRAALQSCLYNLNNLKKFIEKNQFQSQRDTINKIKHNKQNRRSSSTNIKLPEISFDYKNKQFASNSHNSHTNIIDFSRTQNITKYSFNNQCNSSLNISNNNQHYKTRKALTCEQFKNKFINNVLNKSKEDSQDKKERDETTTMDKKREQSLVFRKKKLFKPMIVLNKNQKFFEQKEVKVSQQIIQKLGLYEATNLYKKSNIQKFLKNGYQNNFKPTINLKFATFSLCHRNQFFLTDNCNMPQLNQADNLQKQIKTQTNRTKKYKQNQNITQQQNIKKSYDKIMQAQNNQKLLEQKQNVNKINQIQWIITIENYQVVKNQQYFKFKKNYIEDWNQLKFIIHGICNYLHKVKISLLSFKFEKQAFMKQLWSCRRFQQKALQKLLKINLTVKDQQKQTVKSLRLFNNRAEVIKELATMWKDRQYLQKMKKQKQKKMQRLIWVASRIIAKHKIRYEKKKRISRAEFLNQKLRNGDWDYEIQIHIPSFSQSQFVRNTTQYMEHYENMFYHMWKSSNKQFVLIIPAINQSLLEMLQEKIKVNKNITLICPDSHQLYPKSLPLAACLLYSKDALSKIKKLIDGRKAIIIPGRKTSNKFLYQQHLSNLLNCPLFTKLNVSNLIGENKNIWIDHQIQTASFLTIQPNSTLKNVIQKFSHLICQYSNIKVWLLKINQQFNGRGIAKFDVGSSKKLKQIISLFQINSTSTQQKTVIKGKQKIKEQIKKFICQYLQTHFKLRLKVNFQNCIFRVEEYVEMFLQKGGVIQQYIEDCDTFQLCFKLQPGYSNYSHLYILDQIQQQKYICCTQNYEVNFVTKSSIFLGQDNIPKLIRQLSKKIEKLLKSQKYLGYVSVILMHSQKSQQIYAIQIKPHMTINSSMSYLIKMLTSRKANQIGTTRRNGNLNNPSTIQSRVEIEQNPNTGLVFLFIPCIIFTDVDEATRSEVIQDLVMESWDKISIKLFSHAVVTQNPDTFHGTIYLSLGLSLGMLIYGKSFDMKKMKNLAVQNSREISDKIQSIKLYRGKQETRDVFQFGDLIRAITKIK